jgi:hypothetical protein
MKLYFRELSAFTHISKSPSICGEEITVTQPRPYCTL